MSQGRGGLARRVLRAEMARRDVKYSELVEKLAQMGEIITYVNLRSRLSRGVFTADFFLKCLSALEVKTIRIGDD